MSARESGLSFAFAYLSVHVAMCLLKQCILVITDSIIVSFCFKNALNRYFSCLRFYLFISCFFFFFFFFFGGGGEGDLLCKFETNRSVYFMTNRTTDYF